MKKSLLVSAAVLLAPMMAAAADATGAAAASGISDNAYFALGAGIAIGIAALGGALGQGRVGASAMDGIARNPQASNVMFVPMIVGLALIESLVIYALVIAFMLQGKIH